MQGENLELKALGVGSLPVIDRFIARMGLQEELSRFIAPASYVDALLLLLKNVLVNRHALYSVDEWAAQFDPLLVAGGRIGDDRLGRALDRLFDADRASLQTRIVLSMAKAFELRLDRIHSDTTSVKVFGEYARQNEKGMALKHGYSKDHRPDLKQLVYSLCVSSDGAVPVHFKAYDGNQTDDTLQWETWTTLRHLLQRADFIYVADSKLCVSETLRKIDREHGRFVTMVPKTRAEVAEFTEEILADEVRWERILRKRSQRLGNVFDTFECAVGHYQLREGFRLLWYRSSCKKRRDAEDRKHRIHVAWEKLENLSLAKGRGPKTERVFQKRIDAIVSRYGVKKWLTVEIKIDTKECFQALTRGKPTDETRYRRFKKKTPRLIVRKNAEAIAQARAMDGIFPLTTNTQEKPVDVLKIYKYQPKLEKRHALLKSTFDVAPIWIKNNTRIEALMFIEYLAQMVASLIEREIRAEMVKNDVVLLASLPEGRPSKTPTIEQILRLFEHRQRHELFNNGQRVKCFAEPLTPVQAQILSLLNVPDAPYLRPS